MKLENNTLGFLTAFIPNGEVTLTLDSSINEETLYCRKKIFKGFPNKYKRIFLQPPLRPKHSLSICE